MGERHRGGCAGMSRQLLGETMIVVARHSRCGRLRCLCLASAIGLLLATHAWAQDTSQVHDYAQPAMNLIKAVNAIGQQGGVQVIYEASLLKDKQAAALAGYFTVKQALDKALAGTDLSYDFVNGDTVVIRKADTPAAKPAGKGKSIHSGKTSTGNDGAGVTTTTLGTVTATGTRIRGGVTASPTISIDHTDFLQQGFNDLGEVIRDIPQNYRGGQNPAVTQSPGGGDVSNQDITGGSALNLRGLGPDATLTLLNGRRLSYDGFVQAVDIGGIPLAAVDRLEVVPDGASAIYGSDAVAGVANVILKRDFDGVTLGTRYGAATDGGLSTHEYDATAGTTWNGGGLIVTFKKENQDPIDADQRSYTQQMVDPTSLYPGSTLKSGLLSFHQSLGDVAEFSLDALRTQRGDTTTGGYPGYYYVTRENTSALLVAPTLKFYLPGDWTLTTGATRGRDSSKFADYYVTPTESDLQSLGCYCDTSWSWEMGAEGPLFDVEGNEVRLATGIGTRGNSFHTHSNALDNGEGGSDRDKFAYAELAIPFVSSQNAQPGLHRLELSLAARTEQYDNLGRVTTPKVGLIYDPIPDISLKASWGRSFKVPTLLQRYTGRISYLWNAQDLGGSGYPPGSTVLMSSGGTPQLKPEHATTWTQSIELHPESLPSLDVELSYFSVNYTARIAQPIVDVDNTLSDPAYGHFITYQPTVQQQQDLLKNHGDIFYNYSSGDYDPSKVVAIASDQYVNVDRQRARGVDLNSSYRIHLTSSQLMLSAAASWLKSSQKDGVDVPSFDLSGTIFHPAKLNGRFGAVWQRDGFSASGFVNYTQGVNNMLMLVSEQMSSFTTFDTTLVYQTRAGEGTLDGITVSLGVQNLFNRKPPLYTPPTVDYPPYDPTNSSPIGRNVSLSLSKHW